MNVLIIGANGFTGRNLLHHLSSHAEYTVTGSSLRPDIRPESGYAFIQADLTDYAAVENMIRRVSPDVVINTSALSVPDYCEQHREEAYSVNVAAIRHLAECCDAAGCQLIHLSSDFVFDGRKRTLYTEEDLPAPVNYYGETKWLGEQAVAQACRNWAVARVVVVYGKALPGQHGNILQLVKTRLERGEPIRVVSDQWRTPTWVKDVCRGIELLALSRTNGLFHICGNECLSIADMAYHVADYFHLDRSLIQPVTTEEMKEATPRPAFSGLSIEKACRELGYAPHTLEEGLEELRNRD